MGEGPPFATARAFFGDGVLLMSCRLRRLHTVVVRGTARISPLGARFFSALCMWLIDPTFTCETPEALVLMRSLRQNCRGGTRARPLRVDSSEEETAARSSVLPACTSPRLDCDGDFAGDGLRFGDGACDGFRFAAAQRAVERGSERAGACAGDRAGDVRVGGGLGATAASGDATLFRFATDRGEADVVGCLRFAERAAGESASPALRVSSRWRCIAVLAAIARPPPRGER
jgi:hypothetical protein